MARLDLDRSRHGADPPRHLESRQHQSGNPRRVRSEGRWYDIYGLSRFVDAQCDIYAGAIHDLGWGKMNAAGMDVVFPRLALADNEQMANRFLIGSLDEAGSYLSRPLLGGRYRECVGMLQRLSHLKVESIFGPIGARHLHASLTLFSEVSDEFLLEVMFDVWFEGLVDEPTARRMQALS